MMCHLLLDLLSAAAGQTWPCYHGTKRLEKIHSSLGRFFFAASSPIENGDCTRVKGWNAVF